jgi:CheY-like chemotaxis protein
LDVGNCGFDHSSIRRLLEREFSAEVEQANSQQSALQALRDADYALVLVNRKFDRTGEDGLSLIQAIKSAADLQSTPVMLISNYEEYQSQAVEYGAEPGFGKAQLGDPATRAALAGLLENA